MDHEVFGREDRIMDIRGWIARPSGKTRGLQCRRDKQCCQRPTHARKPQIYKSLQRFQRRCTPEKAPAFRVVLTMVYPVKAPDFSRGNCQSKENRALDGMRRLVSRNRISCPQRTRGAKGDQP